MRPPGAAPFLLGGVLALGVPGAGAELLVAPTPGTPEPVRLTYEIVPAEAPLPDEIQRIEGARLVMEEVEIEGARYWKSTVILPLPDQVTLERTALFLDDGGRLRMLGHHHVRRERERPTGATIVFDSGRPNPLKGVARAVPADTYTWLGLWTGLRGSGPDAETLDVHVWHGGEAREHNVTLVERTTLDVLASEVPVLHWSVRHDDGEPEAEYWLDARPPHPLVQYVGPGGFLLEDADPANPIRIRMRATSSSLQIRDLLSGTITPPP